MQVHDQFAEYIRRTVQSRPPSTRRERYRSKISQVLFVDKQPDGSNKGKQLKLIDFDTCQDFGPDSPKAQRIVGTPGYIAPESFKGDYTPASDLWSVGVILYEGRREFW